MPPSTSAAYTPELSAMGFVVQVLLHGDESLVREGLVKRRGFFAEVEGGINLLGNMYNYDGPMLWIVDLYHDQNVSPDEIMAAADPVIEQVRTEPLDQATLDRAVVKLRSSLYDQIEGLFGFGRADLLASFALFDDDPARINTLEDQFRKITPAMVQQTAEQYLRPTNRTILVVETKSASSDNK